MYVLYYYRFNHARFLVYLVSPLNRRPPHRLRRPNRLLGDPRHRRCRRRRRRCRAYTSRLHRRPDRRRLPTDSLGDTLRKLGPPSAQLASLGSETRESPACNGLPREKLLDGEKKTSK